MKRCHTIDGSLPPCLGDSGGSDAPIPIGVIGSGGLGSGGGGLGSLGAPIQVEHRHPSNKKISNQSKNKVFTTMSNYNFSTNIIPNSSLSINECHNQIQ